MGQNPLGFLANAFSGAIAPGRVDPQSALWNTSRHGKYYASVYGTPAQVAPYPVKAAQAGLVFRASNPTALSLSVALATTYTGLCLSNPAGSTVNLVVKRVGLFVNASAAAAFAGLITGWSAAGVVTHTTPETNIVPAYVGAAASSGSVAQAASQAKVDRACTIVGTPAWDRWIGAIPATTVTSLLQDLDDDLIIPPGGYVAIGSSAAETTDAVGTIMWEEIAP